jgi:hypothetical protein
MLEFLLDINSQDLTNWAVGISTLYIAHKTVAFLVRCWDAWAEGWRIGLIQRRARLDRLERASWNGH